MADAANFLVALLWWGLWGPTTWTNRMVEALVRRAPSVESDSVAEAERQLRAHLAGLPAAEQRRLTYEIAREVFGDTFGTDPKVQLWDEVVALLIGGDGGAVSGRWIAPTPAALASMLDDDAMTWRAIATGAIACAAQSEQMRHAAARARRFLRPNEDARELLVQLLGKEHDSIEILRARCTGTPHPTSEPAPAGSQEGA